MLLTNLSVKIQLFQPYFYYSVVLLIISFICVKLLVRYNHLSTRTKSIMYILPLVVPIIVMMIFPPQTEIWIVNINRAKLTPSYNLVGGTSFLPSFILQRDTRLPIFPLNFFKLVKIPSITGMLCLTGLILALVYLIVMVAFGRRITIRIFRVIEVSPDEYKPLQERIKELSQKLGIQPPKVGLVEDLRPNAFTIGFGSNTTIVFSLGILKILDEDELSAVAAHELSHIKNNDFFFKTLSLALAIASFFNPIAYFLALASHREREMLTDEESIKILEKPRLLVEALTKTYKVLGTFPKEGILTRLASGLFLVSPIAIKHNILFQTHPKLEQRVTNIKKLAEGVTVHRYNYKTTVILSLLIILFGIASTYPFISIQVSFIREQRILPFRGMRLDFVPNLRNKNFGPYVYYNTFVMQPKVNLYHGYLIRTTLRDTTFSGSRLNTSGSFSMLRAHIFLYRNIFLNFIQRRFFPSSFR